jgi:uncharacterized protein YdaT
MPWSKEDHPDSMKNLIGPIKEKAIDIANTLVKEGYEEGRAISIGIAQAKKWVDDQNPSQHVVPHSSGWAIKAEHADRASFVFETKSEALEKGRAIASNQKTQLVIHRQDGTIEKQQNYGL